jgi:DNA-binding MarR family transcriptional regulator
MSTRVSRRSTKPPSEQGVAELAFQLHSAVLHLMRRIRHEDDALGLSAPRLSALSTVAFGEPRTLGEMARMEQVTPPTMTRMVASLEREGLVTRKADRSDKRVIWVEATAKGRRLIEQGRTARVAFLAGHLAGLTAEERRVLAEASELMHGMYFATRDDRP